MENLTGTTQSNISSITILVSNSFSSEVRALGELITPVGGRVGHQGVRGGGDGAVVRRQIAREFLLDRINPLHNI